MRGAVRTHRTRTHIKETESRTEGQLQENPLASNITAFVVPASVARLSSRFMPLAVLCLTLKRQRMRELDAKRGVSHRRVPLRDKPHHVSVTAGELRSRVQPPGEDCQAREVWAVVV